MPSSRLHRARLGLVAATGASAIALGTWFPFGELFGQRGQLTALQAAVVSVQQKNASLRSEIANLKKPATIETIAHQEFGLVHPGQLAFVIEPAAGAHAGAPALAPTPISSSDLVADPPAIAPTSHNATPPGPGFAARFLSRLEFWRHG